MTGNADKNCAGDTRNGDPCSSVMGLTNAGADGGGGENFGDGFAGSMEGVGGDSGNEVDVLLGRDGTHAVAPHHNRPQRPRRHHDEKEVKIGGKAVSTTRSFYDPSEIARRSRRLWNAYGGDGDDGRSGSVSPRRADTIRFTKVGSVNTHIRFRVLGQPLPGSTTFLTRFSGMNPRIETRLLL